MQLDSAACYRAVSARDARFDGRFFTAVLSTGIFCRPICPARTPRVANCRFYPSAAAALDAGFRPCLRCRPETSPGAPAWNGTSAVVTRALRLIERGRLDEGSLADLCDGLGVGERQLRRLFEQHLGASPVSVANARRLLFAKKLLEETAMPVDLVARSSGFGSTRRMREVVQATYGRPPSGLRKAAGGERSDVIEMRLGFRPPYDREAVLAFLAARAIPGVELVRDGVYERTIRFGERAGRLRAWFDGDSLRVRLAAPAAPGLLAVAGRVRALFDLDADPAAIAESLGRDRVLHKMAERRPGLRVPGAWDGFELAVRAVLGQQVTVAGASTLAGRIVERYGEPVPDAASDLDVNRLFPRPEALAEAPLEEIGLPGKRAATLRAIARARIDFTRADAPARLLALDGVGPWTAEYVAMRALSDPDAFPASDLGLRRAWERLTGEAVSAKELERRAEAWRPWRAYAALYLWTSERDDVD